MPKLTFDASPALHEIVQDVSPQLFLMARTISPLLVVLGWPDRMVVTGSTKVEWKQEALRPNSSTVAAGFTNSATSYDVATGEGTRFRVGDIIQAAGSRELQEITGISTDTLTVTRGIRGSTGVAGAAGVEIKRIQNPKIEGADAGTGENTDLTPKDNYTQEFEDSTGVSDSQQNVQLHGGITDSIDHQVTRLQQDLTRNVAYSALRGRRQTSNPEGTASVERTMDGLIPLITGSDAVRVAAGGAALDEALINDALESIWAKGGKTSVMGVHPKQQRKLSALIEGRTRFGPSDHVAGAKVTMFQSDFGDHEIMLDFFVPEDVVLFVDPTRAKMRKLDKTGRMNPFDVTDLSRTGSAEKKLVRSEVSLEAHNADDGGHGMIEGLALA